MPYAFEGLLRRELQAAGASLGTVAHGSLVELQFSLPESEAPALMQRLNDAAQGRVGWLAD